MTWYDLRDEVVPFLGDRLTTLFAHAISSGTDCLICSTFFRRILIDSGEDPDRLRLDEWEQTVVAFGRQLAVDPHGVSDELFGRLTARLRRADRRIDRICRPYGRDQSLQQRTASGPGRIPLCLRQRGPAVSTAANHGGRTAPDLAGQVALITGTAHGQGRASALALAREGVKIVALDVAKPLVYPGYPMGSTHELETLASECRTFGVECLIFAADVRHDGAVRSAVQAAAKHFGTIDILFNNAGICGYGLAHELTEDAWDAMIDINLKGAWVVARHVIPVMIERRRGVIINNSSVAGRRGTSALALRRIQMGTGPAEPSHGRSSWLPTIYGSSRSARRASTLP